MSRTRHTPHVAKGDYAARAKDRQRSRERLEGTRPQALDRKEFRAKRYDLVDIPSESR